MTSPRTTPRSAPRSAPRRRGSCPGVLAPMAVGDGFLVRVRVPAGVLPADKARAIAELGGRYGSGLIDLSQRANLQLRGVAETDLPALTEGLRMLGYVSADAASEGVRNVMASPAAGLDGTEVLDVRPYVLALDDRLAADRDLHRLPAKFGWLVCGGGRLPLAGSRTDVRFDAVATEFGPCFRVALGGTLTDAVPLGLCRPADLVEVAAALGRAFLALRAELPEPPRRMAGLVAAVGAEKIAAALPMRLLPLPAGEGVAGPAAFPDPGAADDRWLPAAFPFGRLTCATLAALAELAEELRLTPWRGVLLVRPRAGAAEAARRLGAILDPADPRLKVTACSGITGCDVGTTDTHADGVAIAERAGLLLAAARMVHVSGCAKGCAHPGVADVTLTAREGVYDLALAAAPGAPPRLAGLSPADAVAAVADLTIEEVLSGA
ncbi:precorrin-3B synthase [Azospirillum thermophilum]|uniref:Precorrin-3B synthase n=2 Tax=Azospirillum thermophilum TaxID=2202148 RepID=A0A2S2CKA4_9PROT|nr:precorrin-3B synthase [Azospirillum thermophilum]